MTERCLANWGRFIPLPTDSLSHAAIWVPRGPLYTKRREQNVTVAHRICCGIGLGASSEFSERRRLPVCLLERCQVERSSI